MSFSRDVKDELARIYPERDCCRRAELAAIVRAAGTLQISSGRRMNVLIATEHAGVARKAFRLLKDAVRVRPEFILTKQSRLRKGSKYVVRLGHADSETMLAELGFSEGGRLSYGVGPEVSRRLCCARAYLRGFFLGRGSISAPSRGHHLEMIAKHQEQARDIRRLLAAFKISPSILERASGSVVYIKEGEQIARLLNVLGAHTALLDYENVRVLKDVKNRVNRLVNMETANIGKIAEASARQANDITGIRASIGLEALPPALRRLAAARLQHPEVGLEELGEMMVPPLSKSAVNHGMRRIRRIAKALEHEGPGGGRKHEQHDRMQPGPDE